MWGPAAVHWLCSGKVCVFWCQACGPVPVHWLYLGKVCVFWCQVVLCPGLPNGPMGTSTSSQDKLSPLTLCI